MREAKNRLCPRFVVRILEVSRKGLAHRIDLFSLFCERTQREERPVPDFVIGVTGELDEARDDLFRRL